MRKVYLIKNANGDTRTAPKSVTWEEFQIANRLHINDVRNVMAALADEIESRGPKHDFTKISREAEFYNNFGEAMNDPGANFTDLPWYKMHVAAERHHLNNNVPEDVNLIDVLEMIVDVVCATKARKGNEAMISIEIDSDILQKAVTNTMIMLDGATEVKDANDMHKFVGGYSRPVSVGEEVF